MYEEAGAAAISVLTESTFFDGSLEHLRAVTSRVTIPVLRKDFVVDEYQIAEAAAEGADAVLLLRRLADAPRTCRRVDRVGLDALIEIHDASSWIVRCPLARSIASTTETCGRWRWMRECRRFD